MSINYKGARALREIGIDPFVGKQFGIIKKYEMYGFKGDGYSSFEFPKFTNYYTIDR